MSIEMITALSGFAVLVIGALAAGVVKVLSAIEGLRQKSVEQEHDSKVRDTEIHGIVNSKNDVLMARINELTEKVLVLSNELSKRDGILAERGKP
jgi:hypothetical protein